MNRKLWVFAALGVLLGVSLTLGAITLFFFPGQSDDSLAVSPEFSEKLLSWDETVRAAAAEQLAARGAQAAIPYLIETLQFEIPFSLAQPPILVALERLSRRKLGAEWWRWYEWWWSSGNEVPEDFLVWKARLYSERVPSVAEFFDLNQPRLIPLEQVVWGGVPKDGIPALIDPEIIPAAQADYLDETEMIFGISLHGEARAYPIRILDWHELVNDTVGGEPVALSDCTLCGSAILYGRRVGEKILTFGTSGLLFKSNKLMYDQETGTLWINFLGTPVVGPLAAETALRLKAFALTQTTWADWKTAHPQTTVLAARASADRPGRARRLAETGTIPYEPGSAYREYRNAPDTFFPVAERDARLPPRAWVFGLVLDGRAKAYSIKRLSEQRLVNDQLGETRLVILAESASGAQDWWGSGGAVRAYERGRHVFELDETGQLRDEQGRAWHITEEYLESETGERLARLIGHKAYWFAWYAFYPKTQQ